MGKSTNIGNVLLLAISVMLSVSTALGSGSHSITRNDPLGVVERYLAGTPIVSSTDSVKIVALRVEFVEDNVATTTGNGKFDLSTVSDYVFDKPPHNKSYFEQQLEGLSNYFKRISKKRLLIGYDVFPAGENEAYQLDHDMVYYSGQEDEELKKLRWAELLRDAVQKADGPEGPDFDRYDIVIVFHAGVGSDISFDFDPTPYDIQSVFLDFESLQQGLAPDDDGFEGIKTTGNALIREGIILPETQNQQGIDLGVLGTMTLLVGSQLGMPSLFNTDTGLAGVGRWGLMDQGSFNLQGLVPAEPCAWTKIYMGWEQPVTLTQGTDIKVAVSKSSSAPHIYKIPITSEEYFLIENRHKDPNGDGVTFGRDQNGKRVQIDTLGQVTADEGLGVITSIDEYDFGLPGSGLLIWHIDEGVIRENLASNSINNNPDRRGVDLVECDGAQDIGYQYNMFQAGYGTEAGDYWDPYWAGNVSHKTVNESEVVELSPTTVPNSNTNDNAKSHVRIFNISVRDTVMTFSVSSDKAMKGFPAWSGTDFSNGSLLDVAIQNQSAVVAVSASGRVLGWKNEGQKLIDNQSSVSVATIYGDSVEYDYALMIDLQSSVSLAPVAMDVNNDGADEIIIVNDAGELFVVATTDGNDDGFADLLATIATNSEPGAGLVGFGGKIVFGDRQGQLHVVNPSDLNESPATIATGFSDAVSGICLVNNPGVAGVNSRLAAVSRSGQVVLFDSRFEKLWEHSMGAAADYYPVSADFSGEQSPSIVILGSDGTVAHFSQEGEILSKNNTLANLKNITAPAIGDVDQDGLPEILVNSSSGLFALESDGYESLNFPISYMNKATVSSPIWYRNDDRHLILAGRDNLLFGYDNGKVVSDFPLAVGGETVSSPLFTDLDGDGSFEIFQIAADGFLYGWQSEYATEMSSWSQYGGGKLRTFSYIWSSPRIVSGSDLMPEKSVFCYPNPAENNKTFIRYLLNQEAESVSIRIFDMAGTQITELPAGGMSAGEHNVLWDVTNIESGVYLASVEARSGSQQNSKIIKIAVIK